MRGFAGRVFAWLESRAASFWILASWLALVAVWVLPFQIAGQSNATLERIGWEWLPLRVVYALVALTTLLCTYARIRRDIRRARALPAPGALRASAVAAAGDVATLESRLSAAGYRISADESSFRAVKHAWSPLGGSLFHLGIIVFGLAVVVHFATVRTLSFRTVEGQSISDTIGTGDSERWASDLLQGDVVKSVDETFYRDVLLFTGLRATISRPDGSLFPVSLSRPHWLDPATTLSIQDFGYAPVIDYSDGGGASDTAIVAMNIFPPGAEDSVELKNGLRVSVIAYPDYAQRNGQDLSLSYNARNPRFLLSVSSQASGAVLVRGLVGLDEPLTAGDFSVRVQALRRHGTFRLLRSWGLPLAVLAGLLTVLGLATRLLFRRHDVLAWQSADGMRVEARLDAANRDEALRKLFSVAPEVEGSGDDAH